MKNLYKKQKHIQFKTPALQEGVVYSFSWNDTYSNGGWFTEAELDEKTVIQASELHTSVGYFVKQSGAWFIIATHRNPHDGFRTWGDLNWIPVGAVTNVRALS